MIDLAKKATIATVKSFVRKNRSALHVLTESQYDSGQDGVRKCSTPVFTPAQDAGNVEHTMGVQGAWIVGGGRDYITPFCKDGFEGYNVYNSCGSFSVGVAV